LIAFNYYELIALLLTDAYSGGQLFYDFLSFWLLFSLAFFLLNTVTNRLSQVRVHFSKTLERFGNIYVLFVLFGNFLAVIFFTLPMAPFQPNESAKKAEVDRSELLGRQVRILSAGTLVPFTGEKIWIDPQVYVEEQTNKRWLLYATMLGNGNSMLCDAQVQHARSKSGATNSE
jgi:predicted membrane protein